MWQKARDIFDAALELPKAQQFDFLKASCHGDTRLLGMVQGLLACDEEDDTLVSSNAREQLGRVLDRTFDNPREGRRLGPWRLAERLGHGGMGAVYLAERDDPFHMRAALKLVRFDMEDERARRLFRAERQILAQLDHPNIARLLDGGETPEGAPYLVMEFVDGVPITEYCDSRRLSIRERIELVCKVCDAVQYAHQNLVIHRDIKPGNILIDAQGEPKLLDFGIAKLLEDHDDSRTKATLTSGRLLTPNYASPEQLLAEHVTTAGDVYSLGVLLYELLCGTRPHQLTGQSLLQIQETLDRGTPLPPSKALDTLDDADIARVRAISPSHLRRRLKGDLDTILLYALRREAHLRYASAGQFAEDLRRHLKGEPVLARPGSWTYRAGKFVKRNRTAVVAALLLAVFGVGFLIQSRIQTKRVARERDLSNSTVELLVSSFRSADPGEARGRTLTAPEILENGLAAVRREKDQHPDAQATLLLAIGRIYLNLGALERADLILNEAKELRGEIYDENDPKMAESYHYLAELCHEQGQYDQGERLAEDAVRIRRNQRNPVLTAESMLLLGRLLCRRGDRLESLPILEEALELLRNNNANDEIVSDALVELAYARTVMGDFDPAEQLLKEALAIQNGITDQPDPRKAVILRHLGNIYLRREQRDEAVRYLEESLDMNRQLYNGKHGNIAVLLHDLAKIKRRQGDLDAAEDLNRQSIALKRELLGYNHPSIAGTLHNLAIVLTGKKDLEGALEAELEALAVHRESLGRENSNLATLHWNMGFLLREMGRPREAELHMSICFDLICRFEPDNVRWLTAARVDWARAAHAAGEKDLARNILQEGLRALGPEHPLAERLNKLLTEYQSLDSNY
ncbi:MAG: serine/threonine-protein kinase [Acidobacteriota bacterium]|nr:serine/threonine-protein kinase [Acidobacteriota bacterium]